MRDVFKYSINNSVITYSLQVTEATCRNMITVAYNVFRQIIMFRSDYLKIFKLY